MRGWLNLFSSPIGLVDCGLLLFAIVRITYKRMQEQRIPGFARCLAAFCGVAIIVSTISYGTAFVGVLLPMILIPLFHLTKNPGLVFVLALVGPQFLMPIGILVGYLIGNPMSRMFWSEPAADSDEIQN